MIKGYLLLKRDLIIYFLVFFLVALVSLSSGIFLIGDTNGQAFLLLAIGIVCLVFSYKYLQRIRGKV